MGCTVKQQQYPDAVDRGPLVVDEAMQQRQWPPSVAHWANGQTPAWPTAFLLEPQNDPAWQAAATDTPLFVVNCLAMPVVSLFTPPWDVVIYPRGEIEPTYTAMPPLPAK